ncbi:unnamed protein product [Brachionus calyciflorus]|uniref:Endonuclease n=1 Tax=Brachionus calyciflorus TaxID=104777 RepID=A0A814BB13_9BILA|nr:unnamed protein product [Brachionus calyciflorus]
MWPNQRRNDTVQHFCSPCVDAFYNYKHNQTVVHKESSFKPERFTKSTDVDAWWTRFKLYLNTAPIAAENLRTIFLGFLDDECIKTFNNYLINRDAAIEKFYNRKPLRDEHMTNFFSDLWQLANVAYGESNPDIESIVKDRFIKNIPVPYIQLELRKNPPVTSYDALNRVVDALKIANNCQQMFDSSNKNWQSTQNLGNTKHKEVQGICRICKQPGHWAYNCLQSKSNQYSNQKFHTNKPSISNVIVNSVMGVESLHGTSLLNNKQVKFLFDTGTVKTIISSKTWEKCRKQGDRIVPITMTLETCNGGPIQVMGSSFCTLKIKDFETKVEVIVTNLAEPVINVTSETPIKQPTRRIPYTVRDEVKQQLDDMLASGIIEESDSPSASPIVLVRKSNGSLRICVDYRRLNEVTIKDCYPLPRIEDLLVMLSKAKYFTTLDLASGYYQIRVAEKDRQKTAFVTEFGLFEFNVTPFGLTNAPATFQRTMEKALKGLIGIICLVYLDDTLIFSETLEEHYLHVRTVLERIRAAKLKIEWQKCYWFQTSIDYLGHEISFNSVRPSLKKVEVLYRYDRPKTIKQLQSFLGLANHYRRFIRNFAEIASPFDKLRTHLTVPWDGEQVGVLILPNFDEPFRIETDASKESIGAFLSQKYQGQWRPVCYWKPSPRLARWLCVLRSFDFDIEYREGHKNGNADALSRWLLDDEDENSDETEDVEDVNLGVVINNVILQETSFNENQLLDKCEGDLYVYWLNFPRFQIFGKNVYRCVETKDRGTFYQYVVTPEERSEVFKKVHDEPLGGHLGFDKTFEKIRVSFYWPNYRKDMEDYIRKCEICASVKGPRAFTKQPIVPIRADRPFQLITWDILGPLPKSVDGFVYILVIICHFSNYVELFGLKTQVGEELAKRLISVVCQHGVPEAALSDRGTNFQSEVIDQLLEMLDIHRLRTSAYHPQCDGETKRFNRTIEQMLACYVAEEQAEWNLFLKKIVFAYNTSIHATTGLTPFEVVYGRKP